MYMKKQIPKIAKSIFKKNKVHLPDFKIYYKTAINEIPWHRHKDKSMKQEYTHTCMNNLF